MLKQITHWSLQNHLAYEDSDFNQSRAHLRTGREGQRGTFVPPYHSVLSLWSYTRSLRYFQSKNILREWEKSFLGERQPAPSYPSPHLPELLETPISFWGPRVSAANWHSCKVHPSKCPRTLHPGLIVLPGSPEQVQQYQSTCKVLRHATLGRWIFYPWSQRQLGK